ncbi:Beta-1,3-endoglucanase, family GH17 [Zostera marina]|uniref:glucan endo-1,3-beta-D-glucosidase n=1 Tax=Zostera marina TaxID=29655 RepID=A0A0K9P8Q7_ZOSMR|nr:Beta-1,3-endoglucanase, family GH17 [Zostera marina]
MTVVPALGLVLLSMIVLCVRPASSQSFVGVNYGEVADNLPSPEATVKLLKSTTISKIRLYGANPGMLKSLAQTGISIVIGTSNADISKLAINPSAAADWVSTNVVPFVPSSKISTISVGNEVLLYGDDGLKSQLLPAMQNLHKALVDRKLDSNIKISTVHPMSILAQSDPPSSGTFKSADADVLTGILSFLKQTASPFMINPYPFFAYSGDPRPVTLAFCLFQPNPGRRDANTGISYTNMFDAQVDAVRSAVNGLGFETVELVVAETGWPHAGDANEVGANVENAKAYNKGLISHLNSNVGTPLMPKKTIGTYIFALYDEDMKPNPTSERSFGLYRPDQTANYDVGLAKTSSAEQRNVKISPSASEKKKWCVAKPGVSDVELQANIDYACAQTEVDCQRIEIGGACYLPNTLLSHANFAMSLLYQSSEKKPWDCDFSKTATVTDKNPSTVNTCIY